MSGMSAYFIRRLMLVPITFFAITFMVYAILRVVPGGPIEQAEAAMKMAAMRGEGGGGSSGGAVSEGDLQLDAKGLEELEEYYALDRPILVGYLQWLGLWQRSFRTRVPVHKARGAGNGARRIAYAQRARCLSGQTLSNAFR
jgi:ABC-type microcin C transport system permease subunit YejB